MGGHGMTGRHPEADLLNSLTPGPQRSGVSPATPEQDAELDEQAAAIEEVLKEADEYSPTPSLVREMHQRMKAAAEEGRRHREDEA